MSTVRAVYVVIAVLAAIAPAQAQKPPRVGYVYPAGGKQGTTFDVTIGGQFLAGVTDVYCSCSGFEATVVSYERPLSGKETELLRERLKKLQEQSVDQKGTTGAGSDQQTEIATLKERIACFANGRTFNTAIAENVTIRVSLAPDAKLGDHELRVGSSGGLSNPVVFNIGQLGEYTQAPARGSLKAELEGRPGRKVKEGAKPDAMPVVLPAVLNGQILAGEIDRFRFTAHRGQRVLVAVNARTLIPYLPDAVPGWFQSVVALYDSGGREITFADDFHQNPDPVLCYQFADDGEYTLAIRDAIYRGREDFVYRITVGELPYVTSIFPLGGTPGTQQRVELRGWNVCPAALTIDLTKTGPGRIPIFTTRGQSVSNVVPFTVEATPSQTEREPNNVPVAAQAIEAPIVVDGRIDQPGDVDVFALDGKAGREIVAEVHARRCGSPLDSVLTIIDGAGAVIGTNDDNEDRGSGLNTHHADSRLAVRLPADGRYVLSIRDAQSAGGPEYAYRLRVGPPQPGFDLRVVPSSISGRAGEEIPVTVHALRRDGFNGDIEIRLCEPNRGFKLNGGRIPAGQDTAKVTLMLPKPTEEPVTVAMEGRATIVEQEVIRQAVPSDDMQQAFAYHHLVPAKELLVLVRGRLPGAGAKLVSANPARITPGQPTRVQVAINLGATAGQVQLELQDPPEGIAMSNVAITPEGAEFDLNIDAARNLAGDKGRLQVQTYLITQTVRPGGKPRRISAGALPPINFEVAQ